MGKEYVDAKYLGNKFKSKYDLYKVLSVDCKHPWFNFKIVGFFLPTYKRCGVDFMKKVLSSDKKVILAYFVHLYVY